MATEVKKCNCNNEFQDKEYGKGQRLMNTDRDKKTATCTVCGTTHKLDTVSTKK